MKKFIRYVAYMSKLLPCKFKGSISRLCFFYSLFCIPLIASKQKFFNDVLLRKEAHPEWIVGYCICLSLVIICFDSFLFTLNLRKNNILLAEKLFPLPMKFKSIVFAVIDSIGGEFLLLMTLPFVVKFAKISDLKINTQLLLVSVPFFSIISSASAILIKKSKLFWFFVLLVLLKLYLILQSLVFNNIDEFDSKFTCLFWGVLWIFVAVYCLHKSLLSMKIDEK